MNAVDYFNRGIKNEQEDNYLEAIDDFSKLIDENPEGITSDIKMLARLNKGLACYNYSQSITGGLAEAYRTNAIIEWEHVLNYDTDSERKTEAQGLLNSFARCIDGRYV